ncbi:hypothetical protein Pr1d_34590 [Bythopirellula goksoeyrii]|uniref:Uncharacterized protein n=1 Tax=Bythopirellula goksoeyrii TaxID=1400387 RepID=A0A5B9QET4_9BACT|nr:hypothetical protein Pr1d_34590 [Bythopirellula goksoeyrii]
MPNKKNILRRQLPEDFEVGDCTSLQLTVQGFLVVTEKNENGDWPFTLQVTAVHSERTDNSSSEKALAPVRKLTPVLWSVRGDGEVEIVVEVGARQRLLSLGLSARQGLRSWRRDNDGHRKSSSRKIWLHHHPGATGGECCRGNEPKLSA